MFTNSLVRRPEAPLSREPRRHALVYIRQDDYPFRYQKLKSKMPVKMTLKLQQMMSMLSVRSTIAKLHNKDAHREDAHDEDVHDEDVHDEDVHDEDVHNEDSQERASISEPRSADMVLRLIAKWEHLSTSHKHHKIAATLAESAKDYQHAGGSHFLETAAVLLNR